MENNNNKVITVCFMLAGILVGIFASVLMDTLAAVTTGAVGRFFAQDAVRHVLPVVLGIVAFAVLQFNKRVIAWADDVVTEIRRIVWPSRKDTTAMTIVVCIMLLISGVGLGLLDIVSGQVISWLLDRNLLAIFS